MQRVRMLPVHTLNEEGTWVKVSVYMHRRHNSYMVLWFGARLHFSLNGSSHLYVRLPNSDAGFFVSIAVNRCASRWNVLTNNLTRWNVL